nr:hypothetical protein [Variovorax boronicumulans]
MGCRTLGETLHIGLRQGRLLIDDFTPRLQRQGDLAGVSVAPRRPSDPVLAFA